MVKLPPSRSRSGRGRRSTKATVSGVLPATFNAVDNRWQLYLTEEQSTSAAYGCYLHRLGGSATEVKRFGRDYGVVHRLSPTTGEPSPVLARAVRRPDPVAGGADHPARGERPGAAAGEGALGQ
ncbi:DUF6417 family protein [Streptomyces sp. NPDC051665]|uniref:DUF6417 family protein n=1 Tax=Streptomyces sp. NPDC051665 TaxID=3154647 RepID=UPI00342C2B79